VFEQITGRIGQVHCQRAGKRASGLSPTDLLLDTAASRSGHLLLSIVLIMYDLDEILNWDLDVYFGECGREGVDVNDLITGISLRL
jgi:hypothetical protein